MVAFTHHVTGRCRALKLAVAPALARAIAVSTLGDAGRVLAVDVTWLALTTEITVRAWSTRAIAIRASTHTIRIVAFALDMTGRSVTFKITNITTITSA